MGGYIVDLAPQEQLLGEKVRDWVCGVNMMTGVAQNQPQVDYMGLQKSFQQEWDFVQHTNQVFGKDFRPVEKYLQEYFFPDLFLGEEAHMPD